MSFVLLLITLFIALKLRPNSLTDTDTRQTHFLRFRKVTNIYSGQFKNK